MANVYKGVGVHWGVGTTSVGSVGTIIIQSRDHKLMADKDEVRDENGRVVQVTYYNETEEATFEFVVSSASAGQSDVNPTLPAIGTMLTVTDSTYSGIAGTNWLVEDVSTSSSNTSAMRVNLALKAYPEITS